MSKLRLDQLLVDRGLVESRTKAQALIMAGAVSTDSKRLDKPGQQVAEDIPIHLKGQEHPWVSRGGMKLAKAIEHWNLDVSGAIALDIGASTGGFTDVLLQHGASKVYAVDVGHNQLHWNLQQDERVISMEKTNARYLTEQDIPEPPSVVVCDASFISLQTVLPAGMGLAAAGAILIALIKPQFEAGKGQVGKGGVVRDPALHQEVCDAMESWMNDQPEWEVGAITESPILGPKGNKEFLLYAKRF
jgi:23S rRNA (cytidine1920-2'-O)/16S rRNA (cytidine1409-2'-O)-methyltransferase